MKIKKLFLCAVFSLGGTLLFAHKPTMQIGEKTKPSLVLYYMPSCPYCQYVLKFLSNAKKTIPFKDIRSPGIQQELIRIGGKRQVPCLVIDGKALYESKDIVRWMEAHIDLLND